MRNIDDIKTEIACLQSESKLIEQDLLNTTQGYVDSIKNIFSNISGAKSYSEISDRKYDNNNSWVNNVFVKILQKSIKLFSPFLITVLTPKSKRWYAPFIASFVNYGLKAASCVNYIYILKLVISTVVNRYRSK
ncbi:MAG: hypothetical protein ACQPRJ_05700 [Solitalea-like symbiont of Acarus siro]